MRAIAFGLLAVAGILLSVGCEKPDPPDPPAFHTEFSEQDFLKYKYYWLTNTTIVDDSGRVVPNYRENYRHYQGDPPRHIAVPAEQQVVDLELYLGVAYDNPLYRQGRAAMLEHAADLRLPDADFPADANHARGAWLRLLPDSDYTVMPELGVFRLRQSVPNGFALGAAFRLASGAAYGFQTDSLGRLALILLQSRYPNADGNGGTGTLFLSFRHVYPLGWTGADTSRIRVRIGHREGSVVASNPPGAEISYLTYFGFDRNGDGRIDPSPAFLDTRWGELHFLDLTPFNPSGYYPDPQATEAVRWNLADFEAADPGAYLAPQLYNLPASGGVPYPARWMITSEIE